MLLARSRKLDDIAAQLAISVASRVACALLLAPVEIFPDDLEGTNMKHALFEPVRLNNRVLETKK